MSKGEARETRIHVWQLLISFQVEVRPEITAIKKPGFGLVWLVLMEVTFVDSNR